MKLTDKKKDVIELCKRTLASGGNYITAASRLTELGFVTARGKTLTQKQVSAFMLTYGKTRLARKTKRAPYPRTKATPPSLSPGVSGARPNFITYIEDIITSNLSDEVKIRAIQGVVR